MKISFYFAIIVLYMNSLTVKTVFSKSIQVGTVLFTKTDLVRKCWSQSDKSLLRARLIMQDVLPDPNCIDFTKPGVVLLLLDYFHFCYEIIIKSSYGKLQNLMLLALSDTIGGYLRAYILPLTKRAYYAGSVSYSDTRKLFELYDDIKLYLKTCGDGWAKPQKLSRSRIVPKPLMLSSASGKAACSQLYIIEKEAKPTSAPTGSLENPRLSNTGSTPDWSEDTTENPDSEFEQCSQGNCTMFDSSNQLEKSLLGLGGDRVTTERSDKTTDASGSFQKLGNYLFYRNGQEATTETPDKTTSYDYGSSRKQENCLFGRNDGVATTEKPYKTTASDYGSSQKQENCLFGRNGEDITTETPDKTTDGEYRSSQKQENCLFGRNGEGITTETPDKRTGDEYRSSQKQENCLFGRNGQGITTDTPGKKTGNSSDSSQKFSKSLLSLGKKVETLKQPKKRSDGDSNLVRKLDKGFYKVIDGMKKSERLGKRSTGDPNSLHYRSLSGYNEVETLKRPQKRFRGDSVSYQKLYKSFFGPYYKTHTLERPEKMSGRNSGSLQKLHESLLAPEVKVETLERPRKRFGSYSGSPGKLYKSLSRLDRKRKTVEKPRKRFTDDSNFSQKFYKSLSSSDIDLEKLERLRKKFGGDSDSSRKLHKSLSAPDIELETLGRPQIRFGDDFGAPQKIYKTLSGLDDELRTSEKPEKRFDKDSDDKEESKNSNKINLSSFDFFKKLGKDEKEEKIEDEIDEQKCEKDIQAEINKKTEIKRKRVIIPLPIMDDSSCPTTIAVPFKDRPIRNLKSPTAAFLLVHYYANVIKCMAYKADSGSEKSIKNFNSEFHNWLVSEVLPHLGDEDWYPAFGGVFRIIQTMKRLGSDSSIKDSDFHDLEFMFPDNFEFEETKVIAKDKTRAIEDYPEQPNKYFVFAILVLLAVFLCLFCTCAFFCQARREKSYIPKESSSDSQKFVDFQFLVKFFKRQEKEQKRTESFKGHRSAKTADTDRDNEEFWYSDYHVREVREKKDDKEKRPSSLKKKGSDKEKGKKTVCYTDKFQQGDIPTFILTNPENSRKSFAPLVPPVWPYQGPFLKLEKIDRPTSRIDISRPVGEGDTKKLKPLDIPVKTIWKKVTKRKKDSTDDKKERKTQTETESTSTGGNNDISTKTTTTTSLTTTLDEKSKKETSTEKSCSCSRIKSCPHSKATSTNMSSRTQESSEDSKSERESSSTESESSTSD